MKTFSGKLRLTNFLHFMLQKAVVHYLNRTLRREWTLSALEDDDLVIGDPVVDQRLRVEGEEVALVATKGPARFESFFRPIFFQLQDVARERNLLSCCQLFAFKTIFRDFERLIFRKTALFFSISD